MNIQKGKTLQRPLNKIARDEVRKPKSAKQSLSARSSRKSAAPPKTNNKPPTAAQEKLRLRAKKKTSNEFADNLLIVFRYSKKNSETEWQDVLHKRMWLNISRGLGA